MTSWKPLLIITLSLYSMAALSEAKRSDLMSSKTTLQQKVKTLMEVRPSTSTIMLQMGERYKNLYWAAKQSKWEFANYQAEEMLELINILKTSVPKRASTASEFQAAVFPMLPKVIEQRNFKKFETAFETVRTECMACHGKNDHGFITLPIPKSANSPVLNM